MEQTILTNPAPVSQRMGHFLKQNLREYGYQSAQPNATTLFQVATLIFNEPARREEALKKWAQWRAEHP